jgi:hypothetical protein
MHINTSPPPRQDITRSAKTAVTAVEEQTGAEGCVLEGWNDEAEEAQFGREEDCEGEIEYGKGYYGVYSG